MGVEASVAWRTLVASVARCIECKATQWLCEGGVAMIRTLLGLLLLVIVIRLADPSFFHDGIMWIDAHVSVH